MLERFSVLRYLSALLAIICILYQPFIAALPNNEAGQSHRSSFVINLTGTITRLELGSKIKNIFANNLVNGYNIVVFVMLDGAVERSGSSSPYVNSDAKYITDLIYAGTFYEVQRRFSKNDTSSHLKASFNEIPDLDHVREWVRERFQVLTIIQSRWNETSDAMMIPGISTTFMTMNRCYF